MRPPSRGTAAGTGGAAATAAVSRLLPWHCIALTAAASVAAIAAAATWTALHGGRGGDPTGCSLRLLAFGDSLTEGYHSEGRGYHPYATRLRHLLRQALPAGCHIVIHERGRSGERATARMQTRLIHTLAEAAANGEPYDWVLLLGGTNDIASGTPVSSVVMAEVAMHHAVANAPSTWGPSIGTGLGAAQVPKRPPPRLFAMTLPPFNAPSMPRELHAARAALNAALRELWAQSGNSTKAGGSAVAAIRPGGAALAATFASMGVSFSPPPADSLLLDLDPVLPANGTSEFGEPLWSDKLHPTPVGYDSMATAISKVLVPAVLESLSKRQQQPQQQSHWWRMPWADGGT